MEREEGSCGPRGIRPVWDHRLSFVKRDLYLDKRSMKSKYEGHGVSHSLMTFPMHIS